MNLLDLVILAVLAFSLYTGYRRGFIRPLIAQAGSIIVLVVLARNPALMDAVIPRSVPRIVVVGALLLAGGFVFGILGGIVGRAADKVPLVRTVDQPAGVLFSGVLTLLFVYVVISGLVSLDAVLQPIHRSARLGSTQVAQLQRNIAATPGVGLLVGNRSLDQLRSDSSKGSVPVTSLDQYDQWLGFYENQVRPQLVGSTLAPIVLRIGEKIPVVGHHQSFPQGQSRDQAPS